MGSNVMVTGGLGMIGALTCRMLLKEGFRPVIYDITNNTALIRDIAEKCVIEQGDITDLPKMISVIKQHSVGSIVHLAGRIGPDVERAPWASLQSNLMGFAAVLESARLNDVKRIVFASSKMVYGPVRDTHRHPHYALLTEDHPREPVSLYGKLKRASEDVAAHYAKEYGLDVVALRFGSSISPGKLGRHSKVSPVVALLEASIANQPFSLESGGDQCDDFCYAGESANAIVAAIRSTTTSGFRAYNISAGELLSLHQVVAILKELHPGWQCELKGGLDYRNIGLGYYYGMDISKARRELSFTPQFTFRALATDYEETTRRRSAA